METKYGCTKSVHVSHPVRTGTLTRTPDAEIVVHVDLANWHPFIVGSNRIHLALVNRYTAVAEEGVFGIVEFRHAVAVSIISNLVIVPNRNPRKLLVASEQVKISSVCSEPPSIVVKSEDLVVWLGNTVDRVAPPVISVLVLIDVVTKMDNVIDRVLVLNSAQRM